MFTKFDKALVPVLVTAVLAIFGYFGVLETMTVFEGATLLVTGALVWFMPNA